MTSTDYPMIDPTKAHPARRYNYWLGGKDHFAADRESGDAIERVYPHIRTAAVQNRRFLQRAVSYLAREAGIRQFLDIGTGLPTADNTHEVAQRIDPAARVVYVDNDPLVMAHARALLTSTPQGRTAYIPADVREPQTILIDPALTDTLDWDEPVALLLVAILHFIDADDQAHAAVKTLTSALPAGSYLALSHATHDLIDPETVAELGADQFGRTGFTGRTHEQVSRFFDGLELIEPGVAVVSDWRPEPGSTPPPPHHVSVYGGVGRTTSPPWAQFPRTGSQYDRRKAGPRLT